MIDNSQIKPQNKKKEKQDSAVQRLLDYKERQKVKSQMLEAKIYDKEKLFKPRIDTAKYGKKSWQQQ